MGVSLSKVMGAINGRCENRAKLKAVMLDLYPTEIKDINILLSVYETGIPDKLKIEKKIDETQYMTYVNRIVDEYGMQEMKAMEGLNAWIGLYIGNDIGEEYSQNLLKRKISAKQKMTISCQNENDVKKNGNIVLYDKSVYVEYRGFYKESDNKLIVNLCIENNSEKEIAVSLDNFLINRYNISLGNGWCKIISHSRYLASANYDFLVDVEDLDLYHISSVEELDFTLQIGTDFCEWDIDQKNIHIPFEKACSIKQLLKE